MKAAITFTAAALLAGTATSDILLFEDFEDATVGYISSVPDDLSDIAARDYFGRIAPDTATPPGDVSFSNLQGSGYYGAQDTDGTIVNPVSTIELNFTGLNITGATDLSFSIYVAEDDSNDGFEDWDTSSLLLVQVQIDGGGFQNLFAVASELGGDGNETNELPRVDTDFDGVGDGTEITDMFTEFSANIAGTGSTLDLRIIIEDLNAGDEDIAIDNLVIEGTAVPEPTSLALLGLGGLLIARRRKG